MDHASSLRAALKAGTPYVHNHDDPPIEASTLRTVLLDTTVDADPRGLTIDGATIVGHIDLAYATLKTPLRLHRCSIDLIDAEYLRAPVLSLTGSTVSGHVDLDRADITGSVFLDGGFRCAGQVLLASASIGGDLSMTGATLTHTGTETSATLVLDGADITGRLALDGGFRCAGQVRLASATIGGQLSMREATLAHTGTEAALQLGRARVDGSAFFDGGFTCAGPIRMLGATLAANCA